MRRAVTLAAVAVLAVATLTGASRTGRTSTDWQACPVAGGSDKQVRVTFDLYVETKSTPLARPTYVEWRTPEPDILSGNIATVRALYAARWGEQLGDREQPVAYPLNSGWVALPAGGYRSAGLDRRPAVFVDLGATDGSLNCQAGPFRP